METQDMGGNNSKTLVIAIVVIVVIAVLFFVFRDGSEPEEIEVNTDGVLEEVELSPTTEDIVPDSNPFGSESANTNPFDSYKNPFE